MAASSRTGMASDLGLLVARLLIGAIFAAHGYQKLVTFGLAGATESFRGMGVPAPEIAAPVVAIVELVGGILLVLGLLTPVVAVLVAIVMAGAYFYVHQANGIYAAENGWELVAVIGLAALTFAVTGPGRFSLDALLGRRRS